MDWVKIVTGSLSNVSAEKIVSTRCVPKKDLKDLDVKKDLKDLDATDVELPAGTKFYTNESLCPYYRDCGI